MLNGAAQSVSQEFVSQRPLHLRRLLVLEVVQQAIDPRDSRVVGQISVVVDLLTFRVLFPPPSRGVVMFQREAQRVDAHVTGGARSIALMHLQAFAYGKTAEQLGVGRY